MGNRSAELGRQELEQKLEARFVISPLGIKSPLVESFAGFAAMVFVLRNRGTAEDWDFVHGRRIIREERAAQKDAFVLLHERRAERHFDDLVDLVEILTGPIWRLEEFPRRGSFRVFWRPLQNENELVTLAGRIASYSRAVQMRVE